MTPLGLGLGVVVRGYALAWFLVNDRVKRLAYWVLDSAAARSAHRSVVRDAVGGDPRQAPTKTQRC